MSLGTQECTITGLKGPDTNINTQSTNGRKRLNIKRPKCSLLTAGRHVDSTGAFNTNDFFLSTGQIWSYNPAIHHSALNPDVTLLLVNSFVVIHSAFSPVRTAVASASFQAVRISAHTYHASFQMQLSRETNVGIQPHSLVTQCTFYNIQRKSSLSLTI